jgi:FMN phosphatase YigB (HAD superfamily)
LRKTIVLFDIDHTLFDAAKYRKRMLEIMAKHIELEDKEKVYQTMEKQYMAHREKIGYVDLEFMLQEIITELKIKADIAKILSAVLDDEASYEEAIFEETIEVVEILAKQENLVLGIFSAGREAHQLRKIKKFAHVFSQEHIHIFKMKDQELPQVMEKYKDDTVVLIDDVLAILYKAKQLHNNITTIWVKRGRFAENQKTVEHFTPDYTVYNLKEIVSILT